MFKKITSSQMEAINGGYSCFFALPILFLSYGTAQPGFIANSKGIAYVCWNN